MLSIGKSTISMAIFNSFLYVYQARVQPFDYKTWCPVINFLLVSIRDPPQVAIGFNTILCGLGSPIGSLLSPMLITKYQSFAIVGK